MHATSPASMLVVLVLAVYVSSQAFAMEPMPATPRVSHGSPLQGGRFTQ